MFDRLVVAAVFSWFGVAGLLPEPPAAPLTAAQLQAKAKKKQISEICQRKKKSKTVRDMCKQWETQNA